MTAEGAYWAEAVVREATVSVGGDGCTCLDFSPASHQRSLLAYGTSGGAIGVWHVGAGPAPTAFCKPTRAGGGDAAAAVVSFGWSRDGTELSATHASGVARLWSFSGHSAALAGLASKRAATLRRRRAQLEASEAAAAAQQKGDGAAEAAAQAALTEATSMLQSEATDEQSAWQV